MNNKCKKIVNRRKILSKVLNATHADAIIIGFTIYFFVNAFIIWLVEPNITTYLDALWFCFTAFSTIGFGDLIAVTFLGRILTVILSITTIFVVALVTGVVVAFYNDYISAQYKIEKAEIADKIEHLDELSKDELKDISGRLKDLL